MDVVYKTEWEQLKHIPAIWNKYDKPIPMDERDLAVWDIGDVVVLPKFFVDNNMDDLLQYQIGADIISRRTVDEHQGKDLVKFKSSIEARKEQIPIFEAIKAKTDNFKPVNGLVIAQPGFGKSIVAIKTVELLGKKSLIIVPNDILEEQFVESIVEFTNLDESDIGIAQGSDIDALVQKGTFEHDIVVVKIQSLYAQLKSKNLQHLVDVYSVFGLIIYDEAHVGNASDGYSKTGIMFKTDNILSMTATPYRNGINDFIFKNNTGGVLYHSDHQNLVPVINLHNGIIEFTPQELQRLQFSKSDYIRFMATYNMILETKEAYFEWIANWVVYRESQGYQTAILFATNKMVKKLVAILKRKGLDAGELTGKTDKKIEEARDYLSTVNVQKFYDTYKKVFPKRKKIPVLKQIKGEEGKFSPTKPILVDINKINDTLPDDPIVIDRTTPNNMSDREIMKAKDTIVSNFKLLSAGFDKSSLSCIIFGSLIVGKVPVIQSLGRICRTHKTKRQDVQAHFMFTQVFMNNFPDMLSILTNNIKTQYPSHITYEGFDFGKKRK